MNENRGQESRRSREQRLRELMQRRDLGALLLRRSANFAWYTGGADNRVDHASPLGVADIILTRDTEHVFTNHIEAQRMKEEQTPGLEVIEHPWYEDEVAAIRDVVGDVPLGADFALDGATADVSEEISSLRYVLDPDALERYRRIGADAAAAVAEAASSLEPGMSEHEAAANLAAACRRRELFSSVLLAAADDRIARYRHPIPHGNALERRAMLVVSAERGGLYANVTRMVYFEEPDEVLERRQEACETILRRMREATRPGRTLADVFADCRRLYAEAGFPDEWQLHHQGGMTGYASREIIATPQTLEEIRTGQAFAWNPSITGAKAEETFILTESGPEVITG